MKPNFALTLSFDGIGLLQRAFPGWKLVGEVALDTADLAGALRGLREEALRLDPSGLRTKLILPDEQLKYLSIEAADDPDAAVRAALDGATPYAVDDLAFDWVADERGIEVAAVARETLAEAEAFAVEHGFAPISFVGQPMNGEFGGEPFFGATQYAASQGIPAEEIDRDPVPVRVIGAVAEPRTAPEPQTETEPARDAMPEPRPEPDQTPAAADGEVAADPAAVHAPSESDSPDRDVSDGGTAEADGTAAPVASFSSIRASRGDAAPGQASARLDGVTRDVAAPRVTLRPTVEDGATGSDPKAASETERDADGATATPAVAAAAGEVTAETIRPVPGYEADGAADEPEPDFQTAPAASRPGAEPTPWPEPEPEPEPEAETAPAAERGMSFFSRRQAVAAAGGPALPPPQSERQRMTVFGAREKAEVGGKPRFLGLILTAILLIFLIGVAAWASIFLDDGLARFFREDRAPAVVSLPEEQIAVPQSDAAADPVEEAPVELVSLQRDEPLPVLEDPATAILSRVTPRDLSPDEAMARYAATGIWQLAPEPPAQLAAREMEEFYQTTLDPEPEFGDAVVLPALGDVVEDAALPAPALPPGPDARFTFDERGLVVATPEGALTPEGVRVFAGLPEVTLPAGLSPGVERAVPEPEIAAAAAARAQLALLRPRVRPDDAAEQIERSGLDGRTRSELAGLRPKLRPESAQEAAEAANAQARNPAARASTVDLDALEGAVDQAVAAPDPFAGATSQAVRASLKPATRPSGFAAIVKQAEEKAAAVEEPVRVAAAQRVAPKIPSTASVAKAATERNALRFERVNLIGVYGTAANRRALVRMSNGRYHKVKVGDRLDGGRVSAIGDGELRYQKSGRNIVLKMPRG